MGLCFSCGKFSVQILRHNSVLLTESSVGGRISELQPRSPTFHTHLRIIPLDLVEELVVLPAIVPILLAPLVVESWVNPHPQTANTFDGPEIVRVVVLGDPLLLNGGVHDLLADAGAELFDDSLLEIAGECFYRVDEYVGAYGLHCSVVLVERKRGATSG